ncbi:hypothetical protein PAXRUDRAFT_19512 [Paxillus rubicundulus Ve08.2h10]|uniref:Uncharacterized protein n=1 Tax=Paxillus rubicundulus Ve08.2h10 TaxID=930991 RepID=A0A0D0BTP9_9AGAM|nr:hypothetical protein PAXRUDRAFT_19512 [Paxillus rubicundulus Ve08.2h10]
MPSDQGTRAKAKATVLAAVGTEFAVLHTKKFGPLQVIHASMFNGDISALLPL